MKENTILSPTQAGEKSPSIFNFEFDLSNLRHGSVVISIDPKYYRPTEVDLLVGNASKAKKTLRDD